MKIKESVIKASAASIDLKALHNNVEKVHSIGKRAFIYDLSHLGKDFADCTQDEIDEIMQNAMTYETFLEDKIKQYEHLFA